MLPYGRKNPLPFPFFHAYAVYHLHPSPLKERQEFKEEGHSFNPRTAREKGLAAYGQTAGVPSFFVPAADAAVSRAPQSAAPSLRFSEKLPRPLGANTLTQFAHPGFPVQKRSRPERANTLTQFVCPGQPVQKTSLVFKLKLFFR